jgi:hypothetical protein
MGAHEKFVIPGGYYDGYKAKNDVVGTRVAEYLGRYLLRKLTEAAYE